jgi:hypothetical protein
MPLTPVVVVALLVQPIVVVVVVLVVVVVERVVVVAARMTEAKDILFYRASLKSLISIYRYFIWRSHSIAS